MQLRNCKIAGACTNSNYITASLICDTSTFDHGLNEIDVYV